MKNRKRFTSTALSALLLGFTMVGCGGGGGDSTPTSPDTSEIYSACGTLDINLNTEALCATSSCGTDSILIGTYSTEDDCAVAANDWTASYKLTSDNVVGDARSEDTLAYLNEIRKSAGLHTLKTNIKLEEAGNNHANYLKDVLNNYGVPVNHFEYETEYPSLYFTGVTAHDRAVYEGYKSDSYVEEALTYASIDGVDSVDELMSAIYHRHGLLFNFVDEVGIGISGMEADNHAYTYELASYSNKQSDLMAISPLIVAYPAQGSTNIRRVFYEEYPDPLPSTSMSGYPVSVEFNSYYADSVHVDYFRLYDANNVEITDVTLMDEQTDPNGYFLENQFALFPMQVLEGNHTYRVELGYVLNGESGTKIWSFTTRADITPSK